MPNDIDNAASSPRAVVTAVAEHLPVGVLTNRELAEQHPDWSVEKIAEKSGIRCRHIVAPDRFVSDMAVDAARQLMEEHRCDPGTVDFVILVTQSPDHIVPTTACTVQHRLGIPSTAGALDVNLGCSGYVYALGLARGLIESGQARRLLLCTADTWSRYQEGADRGVATLFGDGATATMVEALGESTLTAGGVIATTCYGTDGSGADKLMVAGSGLKGLAEGPPGGAGKMICTMDGPEIFSFTMRVVPKHLKRLLAKAELAVDDLDAVILHQANRFMLEHLRRRMKVPEEKFLYRMAETGNTISSTIPLVLADALRSERIQPGNRVALVGFGVGLSWGSVLLEF